MLGVSGRASQLLDAAVVGAAIFLLFSASFCARSSASVRCNLVGWNHDVILCASVLATPRRHIVAVTMTMTRLRPQRVKNLAESLLVRHVGPQRSFPLSTLRSTELQREHEHERCWHPHRELPSPGRCDRTAMISSIPFPPRSVIEFLTHPMLPGSLVR